MNATPQLLAVRINEQYPVKINWIKNEPVRAKVAGAMASIKLMLDGYNLKAAVVQNDTKLTAEGKTEALKPIKAGVVAEIGKIAVGNFKEAADKIAKDLQTRKTADGNPVLTYLQEMEVRTGLQNKTPLELSVIYERSERSGEDSIILRAMENAPVPMNFISPERTAARREALLMTEFPEEAKELEALRAADQVTAEMLALARGAFA